MDSVEYLDPDFDPHKVTVPRLRSILIDRQIDYPSSAKKSELIQLYEEYIRPNAAKWLEEYKKSIETSVEIEEANSSPKKSAKSSRNSTPDKRSRRSLSPAPDQTVPQKRGSEAATPRRKKLHRRNRNAEESAVSDDAESPTVSRMEEGKPNKSIKSPLSLEKFESESPVEEGDISDILARLVSPKKEEPKQEVIETQMENTFEVVENVQVPSFLDEMLAGPDRILDNDSGDDERTIASAAKTMGKELLSDHDSSDTEVEEVEVKVRESEVCEVVEIDGEQQTETVETETTKETVTVIESPAEVESKPAQKRHYKYALLLLPILSSLFLYRSMALDVGFCGREGEIRSVRSYLPTENPLWMQFANKADALLEQIKPQCVPCPEHAICKYDSKLECKSGYTVSRPWQSLLGLIPRMEQCIYDEKRLEKIKLMTEFTLDILRRKNGKEMTLEELHNFLKATKSAGMADEDFEEYWLRFVTEEISKEPEIKVDFTTSSISIENKIPTQFLTRTPGARRAKKSKLFQRYPLPTSTFGGFSAYGN
ncbi:hypothetical protein KL942_003249 [Ogataea angusta]|uniref:Uncharacterized protein n=1 Tax=Pichia angusta TaxID=870730 RepID=A0ABQ7RW11_PICAN|nr:hypothetical protein KL942_003249 [Ogataea angusta]KAG7849271.1 hypothetical protein KL940_002953 [Ogataea angusta]